MLNLFWVAKFKDGSDITQFNEDGSENKFNLDWFKSDSLLTFSLFHKDIPFKVMVDLVKGLIFINSFQTPAIEFDSVKNNLRLIFFRRHKHEMNQNFKPLNHTITYFIGYQYNDEEGFNHKTILQIDNNGNIIIGG